VSKVCRRCACRAARRTSASSPRAVRLDGGFEDVARKDEADGGEEALTGRAETPFQFSQVAQNGVALQVQLLELDAVGRHGGFKIFEFHAGHIEAAGTNAPRVPRLSHAWRSLTESV